MRKFILTTIIALLCFSCSAKANEKKEIKASEIISLAKKGKPIEIVNKIIMDDLDFTTAGTPSIVTSNMMQTEITSNIFFSNCVFMGKVTCKGVKDKIPVNTKFNNNVTFFGCDFRGNVNFDETVVFGLVNFSKSVFREEASFNYLTTWAKDGYFSEIKAEKRFNMMNAAFLGNLYMIDATFDQAALFQGLSVKGKLSCNNAKFNETADFDLVEVFGSAFFNYALFNKKADFSYSRFLHTVDFINVSFNEKGLFEETFFLNTVRFEGTTNKENLVLTNTFFGNKNLTK